MEIEKDPPALIALLSLFYEKVATPAMVNLDEICAAASYKDVVRQAVTFLIPWRTSICRHAGWTAFRNGPVEWAGWIWLDYRFD